MSPVSSFRSRGDCSGRARLGGSCGGRPILRHELRPRGARLGFRWENDQREYQPEREDACGPGGRVPQRVEIPFSAATMPTATITNPASAIAHLSASL
jgi:hypothetical protein